MTFLFFMGDKISAKTKHDYFGFPMCIVVMGVAVVNFIFVFIELI